MAPSFNGSTYPDGSARMTPFSGSNGAMRRPDFSSTPEELELVRLEYLRQKGKAERKEKRRQLREQRMIEKRQQEWEELQKLRQRYPDLDDPSSEDEPELATISSHTFNKKLLNFTPTSPRRSWATSTDDEPRSVQDDHQAEPLPSPVYGPITNIAAQRPIVAPPPVSETRPASYLKLISCKLRTTAQSEKPVAITMPVMSAWTASNAVASEPSIVKKRKRQTKPSPKERKSDTSQALKPETFPQSELELLIADNPHGGIQEPDLVNFVDYDMELDARTAVLSALSAINRAGGSLEDKCGKELKGTAICVKQRLQRNAAKTNGMEACPACIERHKVCLQMIDLDSPLTAVPLPRDRRAGFGPRHLHFWVLPKGNP